MLWIIIYKTNKARTLLYCIFDAMFMQLKKYFVIIKKKIIMFNIYYYHNCNNKEWTTI